MTTKTDKLHFLQDFDARRVHRSLINEAKYNPREIQKQNRNDLKRSLSKIKLREPLVWNEQTGSLVGGHQRLSILDETWKSRKKTDKLDYELTVAVVNIPLKEEIELNIALNNPRLMGDYDINKMNEILSSDVFPDIDFNIAGIKDEDLEMFGITDDLQNISNEEVENIINTFEDVKEQKKREISPQEKELRKEKVKAIKKDVVNNEVDTYVTVSFSNQAEKRAFMKRIGEQETGLYIKGEIFVQNFFS